MAVSIWLWCKAAGPDLDSLSWTLALSYSDRKYTLTARKIEWRIQRRWHKKNTKRRQAWCWRENHIEQQPFPPFYSVHHSTRSERKPLHKYVLKLGYESCQASTVVGGHSYLKYAALKNTWNNRLQHWSLELCLRCRIFNELIWRLTLQMWKKKKPNN